MSERTLFLLSTVVTGLLFYETILWLIGSWIYNSYYSHGFLVLAVSSYFAYRKMKEMRFGGIDPKGLYILSIALVVHIFASLWDVNCISALSLLVALYGIIITFYGTEDAKKLSFPVFFMIFAIPFPIYTLTNVLEIISAQSSVRLINIFGIEAHTIGAEVHLKTSSFIVGAPCSGIRSIVSLLTLATLYTYLVNESTLKRGILVLLAIPLALVANILRISTILAIADIYGREVAIGFFHYASDLIFFLIALLTLFFARRLLR